VGIAIGAGTHVAIEAADVVLMRSSLTDVLVSFHLSHFVFRCITLNLVWAMGYNLVALPFATGILYPFTAYRIPPEFAGFMMSFSSFTVVTSSLLLQLYKPPKDFDVDSFGGNRRQETEVKGLTKLTSLFERRYYYQPVADERASVDHEIV
jgi:Cu+-exporting ATPase